MIAIKNSKFRKTIRKKIDNILRIMLCLKIVFGDRLVVGHQFLALRTGVRIPVPEPILVALFLYRN